MAIFNSNIKYGFISILFHWGMALIILITFLLGKNLQDNYQNYYYILSLHNSFGLLIFLLAIFRSMWRWINIKPEKLPNKPIFMKLASLSHILFYILFFVMPLTGYLLTNLQGDIVNFFGIHLPDVLEKSRSWKPYMYDIHHQLGHILLVILGLHILGALYHHYILKDNTLRRMGFIKLNENKSIKLK